MTERALAERKAAWRAAYGWQKIGIFAVGAMVLVDFIVFMVLWFTGGSSIDDAAMKQCQLMSKTMSPENIPQWCKDLLSR